MNTDMERSEKRRADAAAAKAFAAGNHALIVYFATGILCVLLLSMAWTEGYFWQSWHLIEPALLLLVPASAATLVSLVTVLRKGISHAGLSPEAVERLRAAEAFIRRRSLVTVPVCGTVLLIITIACWNVMIYIRRSSLFLHLLATLLYGAAGFLILLVCLRYFVFRYRNRTVRAAKSTAQPREVRSNTDDPGSVFSRRISFWVLYGVVALLQFFVIAAGLHDRPVTILFLLYKAAEFVLLIYYFSRLDRTILLAEQLASGDLQARFSGKECFPSLRALVSVLGRIRDAVGNAVDERMKSEHLKTELITNVSHDLKTPLTSVINYTNLLKAEPIDNEKAAGYIDVLAKQSDKLRRLTEDLIEASKAATGNLDVEIVPCDLAVMLEQAAGEFEDRFRKAGLTLVTDAPTAGAEGSESAPMALADGRHLWRVFDNLLSNICKYAMPGTRVYITLSSDPAVSGDTVSVTFRNISADPLNIPADQLMQRFVRGDASRTSGGSAAPGNGLGLSIADSLMKLMGGELRVSIDGDLFKAAVTLPKA